MKIKRIALDALLLALCLILSLLENALPKLPFLPPSVKLGLGNIAVLYCILHVGKPDALILALLKGLFAFLTRGLTAGLLSAAGSLLSVLGTALLSYSSASYLLLGMAGGILHNLGQYLVIVIMGVLPLISYYLPLLILSGLLMGSITGFISGFLIPAAASDKNT